MATLSSKAMIEELILTIFIYKWRKCVKSVGEYFLERLIWYDMLAFLSTSDYLFNLYRCICIKRICSNRKRKKIGVISF